MYIGLKNNKDNNLKMKRHLKLYVKPVLFLVLILLGVVGVQGQNSSGLTLVPPSPVSEKIIISIRAAVRNDSDKDQLVETTVYLDVESDSNVLFREKILVKANSVLGVNFRWPTTGYVGEHRIIFTKRTGRDKESVVQPIQIVSSDNRSVDTIDGAWFGFYHWSEQEGALWNDEIKKMSDMQWREQVRAMNDIGMNIIVGQEMFRNQKYVDEHAIEIEGYQGKAFYNSDLFPDRMPIESKDPLEAVLSEADELGMYVFIPVGMYAWFDFTMGSLEWHKKVATELWQKYGHHPSFYGWYIPEEIHGGLSPNTKDKDKMKIHHKEIVEFFKEFRSHVHTFAPDKPIMLASNCHHIEYGLEVYPELLTYLDILCPFGFHRMPNGDITGEKAAEILQKLCDDAGAHLWMDMEAFLFGKDKELYPRPIDGLLSDFNRFQNFEKILCYQFPGLFNAPWASRKPGGEATVKLYQDYKRYYNNMVKLKSKE